MKITVNGVEIPSQPTLNIVVAVDGDETLPQADISITGGSLEVYRSKANVTGQLNVHMFGETAW